MKNETKLKILNGIEKFLGYKRPVVLPTKLKFDIKKLETVIHDYKAKDEELIYNQFSKELMKMNAAKIEARRIQDSHSHHSTDQICAARATLYIALKNY